MNKFFKLIYLYKKLDKIIEKNNDDFMETVDYLCQVYQQKQKNEVINGKVYDIDHPGIKKIIELLNLYLMSNPTFYCDFKNKDNQDEKILQRAGQVIDYDHGLISLEKFSEMYLLKNNRQEILSNLKQVIDQYQFTGEDCIGRISAYWPIPCWIRNKDIDPIQMVGPKVNIMDEKVSLLMLAGLFGNDYLISLFLEQGCDINKKSSNGKTAEDFLKMITLPKEGLGLMVGKLNGTFADGYYVKLYQQKIREQEQKMIEENLDSGKINKLNKL